MLDTPTLQYLIDRLTTINSSDKAITLNNLISSPRIDERLLPYLEQLLTDQSACLISIPYQFGEIRWLAAHVLAKTRA
ncbi:MAG TPA: hypothetical protein PKE58_17965, partial [Acidobacteriota bacterium]|nr:hypothetical protein [Acidobacteriota bacterium]